MTQKHARIAQGAANPYIDPAGYQALIESAERAFNQRMAELTQAK